MIDIKFLRENPEAVKENIKKKFQDHKLSLVDEVIEFLVSARLYYTNLYMVKSLRMPYRHKLPHALICTYSINTIKNVNNQ